MEEISREESVKLKGVAMCVIVLHNFVHLISGVKENEMAFDEERLKLFFLCHRRAAIRIGDLASVFFGSLWCSNIYFVERFYGLAKKFIAINMAGGVKESPSLPC